MKQNLKLSSAKTLQELILQNEINGSDFKDKKLLEQLVAEKIVHIKQLSAKKTKIVLLDLKSLEDFLLMQFSISNLEQFIEVISKKETSRNELSQTTNDTKVKTTKVQTGIYINVLEDLTLEIADETCTINPVYNGSIFINHLSNIKVDKDILIVIVENFENLLLIKKQKYLFEHSQKKILFIFRNSTLYKYLEKLENEIIYFGDIDLAGISIYLNEIKPKLVNNSSFLIPENIEKLLKNGDSKLYFKQYEKYKNLHSIDEKVDGLISLLHRYKKSVEQESFIRL